MNEVQAALQQYVDEYIAKRKVVAELYKAELANISGISFIEDVSTVRHNYAYFPILIDPVQYGKSRDKIYEELKEHKIHTRRYFYPLISQFPTYKGLGSSNASNLPVSTRVAEQVLCLPIYPDLELQTAAKITSLLSE